VAGLNVLNYFNSFVDSECFAGCRGAESALEFERQADKTVATILGLDSDVIALNEIENDGFGPESAIADLVGRLNAETAPGTYAFVSTGGPRIGTDAITVGMLYRPGALTPAGDPAVLDTGAFGPVALTGGGTIQRNRPALAQTFDAVGGGRFTVVANHLKSKGSGCADNAGPIPADPDAGDGQGNCNLTRAQAASELAAWLAGDPTGSGDPDVLITGDLNAYTREDPIRALEDAGYTNLVRAFGGESAYSYVFDGQWGYLDHALASPTLRPQVRGVAEWHVNADEPSVLDYNVNFKSAGQVASLYAPDTFRSSDHDPVVVGIDPADPAVEAGGPYTVAEGGSVDLAAEATGFAGETITYSWDLDGDGAFETPGRTPAFPAAGRDGPSTVELAVRACDETGVCATDGATVAVTDVAPALAPLALSGAEATACRGGTAVSLSLAFTDPGPDGPWTVRVDWGDGTLETVEAAAPGPQAPLTHTYAAGTYEVRVTVSDADGVVSPERTAPVRLLYAASPILSPLAADGSSNVLRRSVIPLFLRVTDCRGRFVPGLAPQVALERIGDGGGRVNVVPLLFLTPTPGTTMSENRLLGLYSYNLGTRGAELGRHRVLVLDVEGRIPTREATFDIVR
jgi:PKD repeat protein